MRKLWLFLLRALLFIYFLTRLTGVYETATLMPILLRIIYGLWPKTDLHVKLSEAVDSRNSCLDPEKKKLT